MVTLAGIELANSWCDSRFDTTSNAMWLRTLLRCPSTTKNGSRVC